MTPAILILAAAVTTTPVAQSDLMAMHTTCKHHHVSPLGWKRGAPLYEPAWVARCMSLEVLEAQQPREPQPTHPAERPAPTEDETVTFDNHMKAIAPAGGAR